MKLFGTVIAVLFHPGSAFRLNGKYDKKEKKLQQQLWNAVVLSDLSLCINSCVVLSFCVTPIALRWSSLFLRALLRLFLEVKDFSRRLLDSDMCGIMFSRLPLPAAHDAVENLHQRVYQADH